MGRFKAARHRGSARRSTRRCRSTGRVNRLQRRLPIIYCRARRRSPTFGSCTWKRHRLTPSLVKRAWARAVRSGLPPRSPMQSMTRSTSAGSSCARFRSRRRAFWPRLCPDPEMDDIINLQTDVLVAGGGAAGMFAAIAAARGGAQVTMLDKNVVGRGGASIMAQMTCAAALGEAEPDSPQLHLADTLEAGRGLCNENLSALLCEGSPKRIRELE